MSTELTTISGQSLSLWEEAESLKEVKKLFAPKLTDLEFAAYVGMGKASGLNPFLREIWSIKFDERSPAQIFIGRDGYRKAAQKNPDYDYHQADAVFENDGFEVRNGEIVHSYKLSNRGKLVGAYCTVKRHNSSRPTYVYVELQEYNLGRSVWKDKPATMIKKVAEAQALRAAFQEQFSGTYSEDEYERREESKTVVMESGATQTERALQSYKARKGLVNETIQEGVIVDSVSTSQNVVESPNDANGHKNVEHANSSSVGKMEAKAQPVPGKDDGTPIMDETLSYISSMIKEKKVVGERLEKALHYFEVDSVESMTESQGKRFAEFLDKIKD